MPQRNPKEIMQWLRVPLLVLLVMGILGMIAGEWMLQQRTKSNLVRDIQDERFIRLREIDPNHKSSQGVSQRVKDNGGVIEDKQYVIQTDADGLILPDGGHAEPDVRLFFLGSSTTKCLHVDEDKRFPYLSGALLQERTGLAINSHNSGFQGSHTMHIVNVLLNKAVPYQPDIAVLFTTVTDAISLMAGGTYWTDNYARSMITKPFDKLLRDRREWDRRFESRWLYRMFPEIYTRVHGQLVKRGLAAGNPDGFTDEFYAQRGQTIVFEVDELKQEYARSLVSYVQICRAWGMIPVLMTHPWRPFQPEANDTVQGRVEYIHPEVWDPNSEYVTLMEDMNRQFIEVTRNVADSLEVKLIDFAAMDQPWDELIYDETHFNTAGSTWAAGVIADSLLPLVRRLKR